MGVCNMIRRERSSWFSTPGAIFRLFVFFCWNDLSQKKQNKHTLAVRYCNSYSTTTNPNSTMISYVVNAKEGINMNKQTKTKIGVGSVVKAKVGELEKITREGISSRMMKEVVGCVHSVVGNNKFLVLFEHGQKKEMVSCSLVYLSEKEEVEMEELITLFPKIEEGVPLTINGDPPDGEPCMFVKGLYLSVFCCLCYYTNISTGAADWDPADW